MPIDYTHPKRIDYMHPGRTKRTEASVDLRTSTGTGADEGDSRESVVRRRQRGLRPDRQEVAPTAVSEPRPTDPVIGHLPLAPPPPVDTGFLARMQSYDDHLRGRLNEMLALSGVAVDARWREVNDAIFELHVWDPSALTIEVLRLNMMREKIQEWAARGGEVDIALIGWTKVLEFVEQIESVERPCDRDWTVGPIELQYPAAVPVEFDHVASMRRIEEMVTGTGAEGREVVLKLADVFNAHIEDFARRNKCELEVVASDVSKAITSRQGWQIEWAFLWPTYFGQFGVYAYNSWVQQLPGIEWHLAKHMIDTWKSGHGHG